MSERNTYVRYVCPYCDRPHILAELAAALRELHNACEHMRRNYGEDEQANARCTAAQKRALDLLARLDAEKS